MTKKAVAVTAKPVFRSPLAAKSPEGALREIAGQTLVLVRGDLENAQFTTAFQKAAGDAPPSSFSMAKANGERILFRLGPDEWLVRDAKTPPEKICAKFQRELRRETKTEKSETPHAAVVNVSDYYTTIQIAGDGARDALAAGCPLDLHPRAFAAGSFAQSRFAVAAVLLYLRDDAPTFEVQVRRSFAEYVWDFLRAAGA